MFYLIYNKRTKNIDLEQYDGDIIEITYFGEDNRPNDYDNFEYIKWNSYRAKKIKEFERLDDTRKALHALYGHCRLRTAESNKYQETLSSDDPETSIYDEDIVRETYLLGMDWVINAEKAKDYILQAASKLNIRLLDATRNECMKIADKARELAYYNDHEILDATAKVESLSERCEP